MKKQSKSKSIGQSVIDVLEEKGTLKLAEIRKALPTVESKYLSATLWNLKKIGVINHDKPYGTYTLTDVNKTEKPAPKEKPSHSEAVKEGMANTISKLNTQIADYKKTLDRADTVYEELANRYKVLQSAHSRIQEAHADALAIIRYFENKLYVAIKTNRT
jgi:chromosome segregation ATPase